MLFLSDVKKMIGRVSMSLSCSHTHTRTHTHEQRGRALRLSSNVRESLSALSQSLSSFLLAPPAARGRQDLLVDPFARRTRSAGTQIPKPEPRFLKPETQLLKVESRNPNHEMSGQVRGAAQPVQSVINAYRGTSLIRTRTPPGPYRRPRVLGGS